jgi:multiple sugar transport system permease protein
MNALSTAHSVVEPSPAARRVAATLVILYALISMVPLFWIFATGWKTPPDSISYPPKIVFNPSLEGYCNLFTTRTRQTADYIQALGPPKGVCDEVTRRREMVIAGASNYVPRFVNSLIIAFGSTFLAVTLGVFSAYAFHASRFRWPTICCSSSCRRA